MPTVVEARERVMSMLAAVRGPLEEMLGSIYSGGETSRQLPVLFDGADPKAMGVYRAMNVQPVDPPEEALSLVRLPFGRLMDAAERAGYKKSPMPASMRGTLRIVVFTLGLMVIHRVDVKVMEIAGDA